MSLATANNLRVRYPRLSVVGPVLAGVVLALFAWVAPLYILGFLGLAIGVVVVARWPNMALVAFFALVPFHIFGFTVLTAKLHLHLGPLVYWKDVFLVSLLARGLWTRVRPSGLRLPADNADRFLVVYILVQGVLFALSPVLQPALRALAINIEAPMILLALVALAPPRRVLLQCVAALLAVVVVFSIGALLDQVFKEGFQHWYGYIPSSEVFYSDVLNKTGYRSGSFFGDSLVLGFFLCGATAFAAGVSIVASPRWRPTVVAISVLGALGLAVTFTRSAYVGLLAGLVIVFALAIRKVSVRLSMIAFVVLSVGLPLVLNVAAGEQRLLHGNDLTGHIALLQRDFGLVEENPFGYGLGATDYIAHRFGTQSVIGDPSADSVYFDHAIDGGVVGGVLYLIALMWTAVRVWRARQRSLQVGDPIAAGLAAGAFGAFVGIAIAGVLLPVQELPVSLVSWGVAGIALVAAEQATRSRTAPAG